MICFCASAGGSALSHERYRGKVAGLCNKLNLPQRPAMHKAGSRYTAENQLSMDKLAKVGDLIKIPFNDTKHTYGRILTDGSYAIYDCSCTSDIEDHNNIIKSDILFAAHVDIFAVKEGYWTVIKNIPLEDSLINFHPLYFNPVPTNPVNFNFYQVYRDEIEKAIKSDWIKTGKIQLDGIYGRVHIEQRINDYYNGIRNNDNNIRVSFFKKMNGLEL